MLKKSLLVFILTTFISTAAYAVEGGGSLKEFTDVPPEHPSYNAITLLRYYNIINGYPDNTFRPEQPINRVEALKLVFEVTKLETGMASTANFSDVEKSSWYSQYLNKAVFLEIVNGYPDGSFKPNKTVQLVEFLKILLLADRYDFTKLKPMDIPYTDVDPSQWYFKYVYAAKLMNLLSANDKNQILPGQEMSRAKAAEIIFKLWQYKNSSANKDDTTTGTDDGKEDPVVTPPKPIDQNFAIFNSESYFFSIQYPKKWFYASLTENAANVIRTYGFGEKDPLANPAEVKLELLPLTAEFTPNFVYAADGIKLQLVKQEGLVSVTRKIEGSRLYRLSAAESYQDTLILMLASIKKLTKEDLALIKLEQEKAAEKATETTPALAPVTPATTTETVTIDKPVTEVVVPETTGSGN